ncbi:Rossmann-like and DUF2520 domain-containing protein [Arachidicoccus terrestris]|uniref:Rossmann-like and DUF2520 domain-containing protein n=1 Tax=Arachidicoccus terrestris TaxID=2875539 RepID=UPI001CC5A267|nr:DUF2520 domain-containing protein [Arachidicoccus terrestris]UAY54820.1 DUF2520 domain-containing protein [Arachidicoccus terrestris]
MKAAKVIIIGSGGVATNIGRLFRSKGIIISQVLGRSKASTKDLAEELLCPYTLAPEELSQDADLYIISIQDREISKLLLKLKIPDSAMIVHTAGGVSIDIFKDKFNRYGILYPLQSLRKETSVVPEIPFYLDSNTTDAKLFLENICTGAGLSFRWANDTQRMQLHVAAVFCSNFPNYFYMLAENFCRERKLDFSSLLPVIEETACRLAREGLSPLTLQTGPAIRKDIPTVEKHLNLLNGDLEAYSTYQYMTDQIMTSRLFDKQRSRDI